MFLAPGRGADGSAPDTYFRFSKEMCKSLSVISASIVLLDSEKSVEGPKHGDGGRAGLAISPCPRTQVIFLRRYFIVDLLQ